MPSIVPTGSPVMKIRGTVRRPFERSSMVFSAPSSSSMQSSVNAAPSVSSPSAKLGGCSSMRAQRGRERALHGAPGNPGHDRGELANPQWLPRPSPALTTPVGSPSLTASAFPDGDRSQQEPCGPFLDERRERPSQPGSRTRPPKRGVDRSPLTLKHPLISCFRSHQVTMKWTIACRHSPLWRQAVVSDVVIVLYIHSRSMNYDH